MKISSIHHVCVSAGALMVSMVHGQTYTNEIRQYQVASGSERVVDVAKAGQELSPLAIDPGGARFELWTIENDGSGNLTDYLLDHKYVGAYVPQATVTIVTEDPYTTVPRTRADRWFTVTFEVDGLVSGDPNAPMSALAVKVAHHIQSYGTGVGVGLDRDQATPLFESYVTGNGSYPLTYTFTNLTGPNNDRSKVRGEERFTVYSLPHTETNNVGVVYSVPESQLGSKYVQIWPVADGAISGVEENDSLRFATPPLTITLNDLYPDSDTYAQAYKGPVAPAEEGREGVVIPGSHLAHNDAIPMSDVLVIDDWDQVIRESGVWTIEVLTETPFGVDRLDHVTFTINRDISVNGTVTTIE